MTTLFLLVCGGAFLAAITQILRKYFLRDRNVDVEVAVVAAMLGAGIFSFVAQFAWIGVPQVSPGFWWPFIATAVINIGIQFWATKALKLEDASIVASLQGITPIFVILTSWLMLSELPTLYGAFGIVLVVVGVYILNLRGREVRRRHIAGPWLRLFYSKGARLALLTAFLGSVALNFDKTAVILSNPMMLTGAKFLLVAVSIYGVSVMTGRWKTISKSCFWPLFGIGAALGLANVLMNAGFFHGIVPYVGTLKRTQILWTTLFAGLFLKEQYTFLRLGGAAIIVLGVVLIAL